MKNTTPEKHRMFYTTTCPSPAGKLTLASDGENLVGLWMEGQKYHGGTVLAKATARADIPIFAQTKEWLDRYFSGEKPDAFALPLAPIGGEFRQGVWEILRTIPYGALITYGDIARKMAAQSKKATMSAQAVGGAVGHNPIAILIPCHRVVGSNGSLTGYAGGIGIKVKLLTLEGANVNTLFIPKKGTAL